MLSVYDQALKYLNMKAHSRGDLALKLGRKGFAADEIEGILNQLEEEGLVQDAAYAETYLRNLIEYRSFGYHGIRAKLLQKRLAKDLVDGLLSEMLTEEVEENIARRFVDKASNRGRARESLMQAMRQKGFRTGAILKVAGSVGIEEEAQGDLE